MSAIRIAILVGVVVVATGTPYPSRGDDQPGRSRKTLLAEDRARLVGEWEKSVNLSGREYKCILRFEKDGHGQLRVPGLVTGESVAVRRFEYAVIDLGDTGRVIVARGAAFPREGNVIPYALGE